MVISGVRVFVVCWNRKGKHKRTIVSDRGSVNAKVVRGGSGDSVRIYAPSWGTIEVVGNEVSRKADAIATLLNERPSPEKSATPIENTDDP
jgi:hypothetical protein